MSNVERIGPIRIGPRSFLPEEIRHFNLKVHDGQPVWDEDPETLATRIAGFSQFHEPSRPEAVRWATHPDERVRVALLKHDLLWMGGLCRSG